MGSAISRRIISSAHPMLSTSSAGTDSRPRAAFHTSHKWTATKTTLRGVKELSIENMTGEIQPMLHLHLYDSLVCFWREFWTRRTAPISTHTPFLSLKQSIILWLSFQHSILLYRQSEHDSVQLCLWSWTSLEKRHKEVIVISSSEIRRVLSVQLNGLVEEETVFS